MVPGTASRLANDEMLAVRGVPERGRPAALHRQVRRPRVRPGLRVQPRDERAVRPRHAAADGCQRAVGRLPAVLPRRVPLQRRRGHDREREALRRHRRRRSVQRRSAGRSAAPSANNQDHSASFITTSGILPTATVPAVRQLGVGEVRPPGRAVRPAHGHVLRVLAHRGHLLQAPDADDQRARPAAATSRSGSRTTPSPTGTSCSSRRTRSARTTGRRCPTRTGTRARAPVRTIRTWRAARPAGASCTRGSTTTRRSNAATARARRRARPARGTRRPAARAAGSSGRSTSARTPASRSRSRSPTRATGRCRDSARSSTTSRLDRRVRRRSRPASAAGRSPGRRPAARRTRTTSRARPPAASPRAPRVTTRHALHGLRVRGDRHARRAERRMGRAISYLLR